MLWMDLIIGIIFALVLSSLLVWGLGWRHPVRNDAVGASLLFLFLVLLFAMVAGRAWLRPWGPSFYGSPWLSVLFIGLFVSLIILAVATPVRTPRTPVEAAAEAREEAVLATAFGLFFWVLILGLLIAAVVSFFFPV